MPTFEVKKIRFSAVRLAFMMVWYFISATALSELIREAAVFAVGANPTWYKDVFDYGNKWGTSFGRVFGIKKTAFKYDGENLTDFGSINVLTASEDDAT